MVETNRESIVHSFQIDETPFFFFQRERTELYISDSVFDKVGTLQGVAR